MSLKYQEECYVKLYVDVEEAMQFSLLAGSIFSELSLRVTKLAAGAWY